MSAADVGAHFYRVIDNQVYTAPGLADPTSAESILVRMTGNEPLNLNLMKRIL
jgi:hypothetical protein